MSERDVKDLFERIDLGIRRGVARALAEHKQWGHSISVWENGQVVKIPPEKIQIPEKYLSDDNQFS